MLPYFSMMLSRGGGRARITTWNAADMGPHLTLSNGDLTVTSYTSDNESVRATTSHSSGRWACRFTFNFSVAFWLGFANSSFGLASALLGGDANGISYRADTGVVAVNGSTLATLPAASAGDTIDMVLDATTNELWVRINAGNWNNNGSADPSTGALGISLTGLGSGPWFPATTLPSIGLATVTAQFYGLAYPGNVAAWDE